MITLENFSSMNRDRHIGNSLYRICRNESTNDWYIHETYNSGAEWSGHNAYHTKDLKEIIDKINSFTKEKEVVSIRFGQ